ncbi:MAG: HPr kinase/phosphatase C-terminal domain-containing protein [Magnetospirillum sp.]|nr:HPr kinase/phosphatase C-terminal domain-containing protein [Magnetospirillum sp.]
MLLVHGTCVEMEGMGVLLRGVSGSGKSDLALRLIDGAGAQLVADDQTQLSVQTGRLIATAPDTIAGLLAVRGLGLVRLPHRAWVPLALVADLVAAETVERMPEQTAAALLGVVVPLVRLHAFEASAPAKVRLAMRSASRDIMRS